MIVGRNEPLYEAEVVLRPTASSRGSERDREKDKDSGHLSQFIIHSALDMVERKQGTAINPYLRIVDKFNDQFVSAYLTAGGVKLMLLHDGRAEDAVGNFFKEIHELYVKVSAFYLYWCIPHFRQCVHIAAVVVTYIATYDTPIMSPGFDDRVRAMATKLL
eukprot:19335-Heterococcus_DN1.PRE.1